MLRRRRACEFWQARLQGGYSRALRLERYPPRTGLTTAKDSGASVSLAAAETKNKKFNHAEARRSRRRQGKYLSQSSQRTCLRATHRQAQRKAENLTAETLRRGEKDSLTKARSHEEKRNHGEQRARRRGEPCLLFPLSPSLNKINTVNKVNTVNSNPHSRIWNPASRIWNPKTSDS